MLDKFLSECNMTIKEIDLYKICLKLGKSTASTIADMADRERTSTYKMLTNMSSNWFLYMQKDNNTTYFLPISIWALKDVFDQKSQNISLISQNYNLIINEYSQLKSPYQHETTINIYEWLNGIKKTFDEIYQIASEQNLLIVKCIASQTFDSMANSSIYISEVYSDFLANMQSSGKIIQSCLGQWMSLMENLLYTKSYDDITKLPNSNNSTVIYIVWSHIFMIIYQKTPKVIHITSQEFVNLFHFLLDSKFDKLF